MNIKYQGVRRSSSVRRPALCVGRKARHRGHKAHFGEVTPSSRHRCVRWVVMVPVLRVLVYYPVRETRMAKAVSSGETSVSRPKNVTWELY